MLDIKFIRENIEIVRNGLKAKSNDFNLEELLTLDKNKRELLKDIENKRSILNKTSKEISQKKGTSEAEELKIKMRELSDEITKNQKELS